MKKHIFKTMSMLLVLIMLVGMMSVTALAVECTTHNWKNGTYQDQNYSFCQNSGCTTKCYHEGTLTTEVKNCNAGSNGKYGKITCTVCSYSYSAKIGEAEAHNFDANGQCTKCDTKHTHTFTNGVCNVSIGGTACGYVCTHSSWDLNTGKCSACGYECTHPSKTVKQYPNCLTGGTANVKCDTCGVFEYPTYAPLASHSFGTDGKCTLCGVMQDCDDRDVDHTWKQVDTTTHKCTVCDEVANHKSETVYNCLSNIENIWCSDCRYVHQINHKDAPGPHNFVNGICSLCSATQPCDQQTPAKAHTWDKQNHNCKDCKTACPHAEYETVAPNCKSEYEVTRCKDCWQQKGQPVYKGFGDHNYVGDSCSICGAPLPCDQLNKEHQWNWVDGKCDVCGVYHEDHNYKPVNFDCTVGGYKTDKCTVCGYTHVWNTPYEPTNHTYENGICTVCGHVCEHKETTTENTATCVKDGEEIVTCNECKMELSRKAVKALGHNYKNGVCTRCGDVEKKVVVGLDDVPKTGDGTAAIVSAVALVALLTSAAVVFSKKREA